jgi:antitoxin component YwqK of YwqJK toxin-antitoxin module
LEGFFEKNCLLDGYRIEYTSNENKLECFFINGKKNGYAKSPVFEGIFKDGYIDGYFIKYYPESKSKKLEGICKENKMNGFGKEYYKNQNVFYCGEFINRLRHGYGIYYDENGKIEYEGFSENGQINGIGIFYHKNGEKRLEGYFNIPNTYGCIYDLNGFLLYEGEILLSDLRGKFFFYGIEEYNLIKNEEFGISLYYEKHGNGIGFSENCLIASYAGMWGNHEN